MQDFLTALALVLVIEGVLYAAFPDQMLRALASLRELPPGTLRIGGIVAAFVGLLGVWLVRGA